MVDAPRTLPDGTHAVCRSAGGGHSGWFGLEDDPPVARLVNVGCGVTVSLGDRGDVVGVGYEHGRVTDSVVFFALRAVVGGCP